MNGKLYLHSTKMKDVKEYLQFQMYDNRLDGLHEYERKQFQDAEKEHNPIVNQNNYDNDIYWR